MANVTTVGDQSTAFDAFNAKLGRRADAVKRYLALDVWGRVMSATPVDTGQARAGWHGSVNRPNLSIPKRPRRIRRDRKTGRALNQMARPAAPHFAPSEDLSRVYWVTNNVAHIKFLNEGSSQQAPAGFVDTAIAQTVSLFDALVNEVVRDDGGL